MPPRKSASSKRKACHRRPNRQVMEARTKGIGFLNQSAISVLVILVCVAISLTVLPELKQLRELERELAATQAKEKLILEEKDQRQRELAALRGDEEFQDLKARDLLDLCKPGEVIYRIQR